MTAGPTGELVARLHPGDMSRVPERDEPAQIIDLDAFRRRNAAAHGLRRTCGGDVAGELPPRPEQLALPLTGEQAP